jgi:membrane protease YdiL (CAAX protease family)
MEAVRKRAGALHAAIFFVAVGAAVLGLLPQSWPWYLLLPILVYVAAVVAIPFLRRTAPRLKIGRLGGAPLACAVVLALATSVVLVAFHLSTRRDVSDLAGRLPGTAFGNIVLAGILFSLVNAALEEIVFRGLVWFMIADEWNDRVALLLTAILFGVLHLHGYPPGPSGAVLAGLYGLALGLLRWWTGGLGLAFACHICADATIYALVMRPNVF